MATINAIGTQELTANGELIIGSGSGNPSAATLTAGTDISITNGAGSVTINATGGGGGLVLLSSVTASTDATIDFDNVFDTTYKEYLLVGSGITVGTDSTFPWIRIGTGAGPTYQSGASDYGWVSNGSGTGVTSDVADSEIDMGAGITEVGSAAGETVSFHCFISNPADTSISTMTRYQVGPISNAGTVNLHCVGAGAYYATTAVTSIRFLMSSGNVVTGVFNLYGLAT